MVKIGLEIHGYIKTREKLFCRCKAEHDLKHTKPNINVCPICTAQPGAKPLLPNKEAIDKVIQIALILGCKINGVKTCGINRIARKDATLPYFEEGARGKSGGFLVWQRKHYDWPDLPKGYQNTISGPYAIPIGEKGKFLGIRITEAHLEEDPAAWNPKTGEINYNRSGSPLIEIVTEPDFKNSEQAILWLKQLISTLNYVRAIDKNSGIKADVNVSVSGGERVEIKNINSLKNIKTAIEHEIQRQEKDLPKVLETRMFDESKGITIRMRTKEQAHDYRFISEPDLPVIKLKESRVQKIKSDLPETPFEKLKKIIKKYKIEKNSAEILTRKLEVVEFFEKIIEKTNPKLAVRWVTEELLSVLNYNKKELDEVEIDSQHFIELLKLIENKTITELKAKEILRSWKEKSFSPKTYAKKNKNISEKEIEKICNKIIKENSRAVEDYKSGKKESLNFLIGQVMRASEKRADYIVAKKSLEDGLKKELKSGGLKKGLRDGL